MKAWQRACLFVFIGLMLYTAVYYAIERLVVYGGGAQGNRFHKVRTAERQTYDYVILGSSHALPFDFEDMNAELERMTESTIINLATAGGGIVLNRLLMEYFSMRHNTKNVLYVVDSFAFYSAEWNEARLKDPKLLQRAPFDPALVWLLLGYNLKGLASIGVTLNALSGFSKLNNPHEFSSVIAQMEKWFNRDYKPSAKERERRIERLYPDAIDPQVFDEYLAMFVDLIRSLQSRGVEVIAIKTPVPEVFYDMIPNEEAFDQRISEVLADEGVPFYNFSLVDNDPKFYFDTDHLNRTGVTTFFENHLKEILLRHRGDDSPYLP